MARSIRLLGAVALALVALVGPAGDAHAGLGLRGGLSVDPDQVIGGIHFKINPIATNLHIVPSAEAGFDDDAFSLYGNGDLQYRFKSGGKVGPYAGAGLSVIYVDPDNGDSDTNVGASVLGGLFFSKLFAEAKLGLSDDLPDWKFIVGFSLR